MKLTVFNGSPRGAGSNTKLLLDQFLKGFTETSGNTFETVYLNRVNRQDEFLSMFSNAETVLLAFPLYTDAMPGIVKTFIETLAPLCGRKGNPPIGFIVQSGFAEAVHSRYVEKYLEKLARRLGCQYYGTTIRGGVEGIQVMPPPMTKKLFSMFYILGKGFGNTGQFDPDTVKKLAGREQYSSLDKLTIRIASRLKLTDIYWNNQLKQNHAYEKRFDKPYQD